MDTIRVIIHSDFLPDKVLYMEPDIKFIELSKKVINSLKVKDNTFNKILGRLLSCFYKIDNNDINMLLKFTDYDNINRNITSKIRDLSTNNELYCYLEEVNIEDIDNYKKRIEDELNGRRNFVDIPLFSESDNLLSSSTINDEDLLSDKACLFRSQPKSLKSRRFFSWNVKKKKIKGHYYSWD